ncbi:MAG: hypothetical protein U9R66_11260 [Thermodesulfobacteriota bacterium]|nr:hypothetical protein [Thermodesulfobacteriota bacterium]
MSSFQETLILLWQQLGWPLLRLLIFISIGLLVANFIEALNWTKRLAVLARPLIRFGRLSDITGASFSLAFFSGVSANTMLAEAYDQGKISKKELVLANLFNSLPAYFLHLPTTFFITVPLIKGAAFLYIGMTFGAAVLRTLTIAIVARFLLAGVDQTVHVAGQTETKKEVTLQDALNRTWKRFRGRMKKIIRFTVPIYILFFLMNRVGLFSSLEQFMADNLTFLCWLSPQAMSIVVLHIAAEFTAGLAAAGALLQDGALGYRDIVLALLVGNILSSPVRAVRHQFPFYAGIFQPRLAMQLIFFSQSFRMVSIALITVLFLFLFPANGP